MPVESLSSVKLVVFDLDGTLVDAYKAVALSLNFSLAKFGYPKIDHATIHRSVGWGDRNLIARFVKKEDVDRVLRAYRIHHKKALKQGTKLLPSAKSMLGYLKRKGFLLGIASNRPSFYTKIILKRLKIADYFQCVLCADQVARPKPAPDLLTTITKRLNVALSETLYVGDMTIDVECGQRARVKTVAVVTGSSFLKDVKKLRPFKIILKLAKLRDIL